MKKLIIRKNYLINKRFQFNHVLSMAVMLGTSFVFAAFLLAWLYLFIMDNRLYATIDSTVMIKLSIVFIFLLAGMILWSIKYTHAIAGPMYKLCNILEDASLGIFSEQPVTFRKHDLFKRVAKKLDTCLLSMKKTQTDLATMIDDIETFRKTIKTVPLSTEECDRILRNIIEQAKKS